VKDQRSRRNPAPIGRAFIGTSGWTYRPWRGVFFPRGLPAAQELSHISRHLASVEVNGTFYSLTRPSTCDRWRASVGEDFIFAIKGSRYITHMLKLANFAAPLANFFASGILRLGQQLGPILWQLPPNLSFREDRAAQFFKALPRTIAAAQELARRHDQRTTGRASLTAPDGQEAVIRYALEARHESWMVPPATDLLREHGIALVTADTAGHHPETRVRTADFAYVRLHGSQVLYSSEYTSDEIESWARQVNQWRRGGADVHVYFDNDAKAYAPFDAIRLSNAVAAGMAGAADGLSVPAIPVRGERQPPARLPPIGRPPPAGQVAVRRR
jgi:uncharacterized protein YecE (DUF72 family)